MNRRELFEKLHSRNPNLKCLFMSGYSENVIAHHGVVAPKTHFISKPFSVQEFASKARQILDGP